MTDKIAHESGLYLPLGAAHEDRYELLVRSHASHSFPDYYWVDFKSEIRHPAGLVHADAALVAKDYSKWIVVEVERVEHSWENHIRPQLSYLLDGWYTNHHRARLAEKSPALDMARLQNLDVHHPEFALIIDSAPVMIRQWCRRNHIYCVEAAPFMSRANQVALALTGDELPSVGQARRRILAQARLAPYGADAAMFEFVVNNEFADSRESFEAIVGERRVMARCYGESRRGFALACSVSEFKSLIGYFDLVDLVTGEDEGITLIPRTRDA